MKRHSILTILFCFVTLTIMSQNRQNPMRTTDPQFFKTHEARRIGDQLLLYQRITGGWPKNIDMARELNEEERAKVMNDKNRKDDSTIDNNATTMQMKFLARLYQATKEKRYREGFNKAVEYLLNGQYENGGWPQFWPDMHGYQVHITFNDDAMVNTMLLLRDIAQQKSPYEGKLTDKNIRKRAMTAFDKGVECILATQIHVDGQPTVWCQQHDRETYQPAKARAYELPSFCTQESAYIVKLLMDLPNPDDRIKQAIHGAMKWFDKYKLTGLRIIRVGEWGSPDRDTRLIEDANAEPIWGRYYDLKYCEPYVCDRDGLPRRHLSDIGPERRNGYSWYGNRPAELYKLYDSWADKYDPQHKVNISLDTKGANENGLIEMYREPK
ncbi:MAG: pectate lyase, partial [Prevotella sp.]|nr:pectate lyase [Prevotella sp.]